MRALNEEFGKHTYSMLARAEAPEADFATIALVHPMEYIEKLHEVVPAEGAVRVDADTTLSSKSWPAIIRGARWRRISRGRSFRGQGH